MPRKAAVTPRHTSQFPFGLRSGAYGRDDTGTGHTPPRVHRSPGPSWCSQRGTTPCVRSRTNGLSERGLAACGWPYASACTARHVRGYTVCGTPEPIETGPYCRPWRRKAWEDILAPLPTRRVEV
ncbi:hypothetical protein C8Q77DRAFT_1114426 [Trametes polyzona]|nr:hypothetical protein C8Q77DRAFT_1114426 [Trametes polyzona]